MEILGVGQTRAYSIIRDLNKEIAAAGYYKPIGGRVSEAYFRERFYLGDKPIARQEPSITAPGRRAGKGV